MLTLDTACGVTEYIEGFALVDAFSCGGRWVKRGWHLSKIGEGLPGKLFLRCNEDL